MATVIGRADKRWNNGDVSPDNLMLATHMLKKKSKSKALKSHEQRANGQLSASNSNRCCNYDTSTDEQRFIESHPKQKKSISIPPGFFTVFNTHAAPAIPAMPNAADDNYYLNDYDVDAEYDDKRNLLNNLSQENRDTFYLARGSSTPYLLG